MHLTGPGSGWSPWSRAWFSVGVEADSVGGLLGGGCAGTFKFARGDVFRGEYKDDKANGQGEAEMRRGWRGLSGQGRRKGVRRAFNGSSVWRKRRVSCAAASGSGDIRAMSGACLAVCCLIRTGPDCRWVPLPIVAFDQCLTSRRPGIERQPILDRSWVVLPLSSRDRLTASGAAFRCLSFICAGVWSQHTA